MLAPGVVVVNNDGNRLLWSHYPPDVRNWISRHGGLKSQIIYLRWPELPTMYRICP